MLSNPKIMKPSQRPAAREQEPEPDAWAPPTGIPDVYFCRLAREAEQLGLDSEPLTIWLHDRKQANRATREAAAKIFQRLYNATAGTLPFERDKSVLEQALGEIWASFQEEETPAVLRAGSEPVAGELVSTAWLAIDPKVREAIELLKALGPCRQAICNKIGVPRTSTTEGRKWMPFNRLLELLTKGDADAFERMLTSLKKG